MSKAPDRHAADAHDADPSDAEHSDAEHSDADLSDAEHSDAPRVRAALLAWYDRARRDLPWRHTRDPYAVWISEVMSQQTRVETVIPYYHRWLEAFPTPRALADADEADVMRAWEGLGYYSRARNLQRAAREIRDRHEGALPRTAASLLTLPGIGPYTSRAIASIAFDERVGVVDGNVARVVSRWLRIEDDVTRPATKRALAAASDALAQSARPGDTNQALMELGATTCTPRNPRCDVCPIATWCAGRDIAERLPFKKPKPRPRPEQRTALRVERADGAVLMARQRGRVLLGDMWQYPMLEGAADDALQRLGDAGWRPRDVRVHDDVTHVFTHIRMTVTPVSARAQSVPSGALDAYDDVAWFDTSTRASHARPKLVQKIADALGDA